MFSARSARREIEVKKQLRSINSLRGLEICRSVNAPVDSHSWNVRVQSDGVTSNPTSGSSSVATWIVFAVIVVMGLGVKGQSIHPEAGPLIIALGDSVTYGVRPNREVLENETFVARLEQSLRRDFPGLRTINAGVPGNNTKDLLLRLDRDVIQKHPDVVIVMIGINDAAYVDAGPVARMEPRIPMEEFRKNLIEIIERIQKTSAKVVLVTPNPISRAYIYSNVGYYSDHDINGALRKYAATIVSVGKSKNVPVVDVFQTWISLNNYDSLLIDGMHPNAEGHAKISQMLARECKRLLRSPAAPLSTSRPS